MPKKTETEKKPAKVDLRRGRAVIGASLIQDCVLSEPYKTDTGAKLVDVLTESQDKGGARAAEFVLPETANAIVAAFNTKTGWSAALDEIERLRAQVKKLGGRP